MSFYLGPSYIGSAFDHPSRRAPLFSPMPMSRTAVPIVRSASSPMAPLLRQMLAYHESAHCVWHWANCQPVCGVEVHANGGQFRAVENARSNPIPVDAGDVSNMLVDSDRKTREEWLHQAVAFAVSRSAQRRFGARDPVYDEWCTNDIRMVRRIVDALGGSARERAENLQRIEAKAELFVSSYWKQISCLADAILRHGGRLNEQQIRSVLSRASSSIALNQTAADHALSLACSGCVNYSAPFAWSDDSDAAELYHLGEDVEADGIEPKLFFPYGANNQIYITALKDAIKSGSPAVASFAQKLLDDIEKMQAQSLQNTTGSKRIASRSHRYPDPDVLYWRTDGFLIPPGRHR